MFCGIDYLKSGSSRQKFAYEAIFSLGIMEDLIEYNPVLCGTVPIGIAIQGSDLDIIMEVEGLSRFSNRVQNLYGGYDGFRLKETTIRGVPVVKVNFLFRDFEFELFGQSVPVIRQSAYLHMVIEYSLMSQYPGLKEEVINLKKQGYKTEPAFCKVLGLKGDPYEALLELGRSKEIIT